MPRTLFVLIFAFFLLHTYGQNTLTKKQIAEGWQILFNGKTLQGFTSAGKTSFPDEGWTVSNGILTLSATPSGRQGPGDLLTQQQFSAFELTFQYKLVAGANSGIKYFVTLEKGAGAIGLEFQLLDDSLHPDARNGVNGDRTLGSLYDLIPAIRNKPVNYMEWNSGKIIVTPDNHVEHWLNGVKVLAYDRGSPAFRELVAKSKYAHFDHFGEASAGYILLQDHRDAVSFRNIFIRRL
ncbi:MAG: DUF1080 domain-containing protein [Bacteroidota bacterium]